MNSTWKSSVENHLARMERAVEESLNLLKDDLNHQSASMKKLECGITDLAITRLQRIHKDFFRLEAIEKMLNGGKTNAATNFPEPKVRSMKTHSKNLRLALDLDQGETMQRADALNRCRRKGYRSKPGNFSKHARNKSSTNLGRSEIESLNIPTDLHPEKFRKNSEAFTNRNSKNSNCSKPRNSTMDTRGKSSTNLGSLEIPSLNSVKSTIGSHQVPFAASVSNAVQTIKNTDDSREHNTIVDEIINEESNVDVESESSYIHNADEEVDVLSPDDSFSVCSFVSDEFQELVDYY